MNSKVNCPGIFHQGRCVLPESVLARTGPWGFAQKRCAALLSVYSGSAEREDPAVTVVVTS